MDRFYLIGLLVLLMALTRESQACEEPPKAILFVRENLEDDIILTMVTKDADTKSSEWSVKHGVDGHLYPELVKLFQMKREGPFWNLVTTSGIAIPKAAKADGLFSLTIQLECREGNDNKANVHSIHLAVFPEKFLEKIQVTVPENTPVQEFIYYDKEKLSKPPAVYRQYQTSFGSDASEYFKMDDSTGSVSLIKALDYEKDPKVMWLLLAKETTYRKVRLFRIEIGNVNDNAPEFHVSDHCGGGPECQVTHYALTVTKNGLLSDENENNKVHAVDLDGDVISYAIVEARPDPNAFSINTQTGDLRSQGLTFDKASRYFLTVQASDGLHKTFSSVTIDVMEDVILKDIQLQLGVMQEVRHNEAGARKPNLPSWLLSGHFQEERKKPVKVTTTNKPSRFDSIETKASEINRQAKQPNSGDSIVTEDSTRNRNEELKIRPTVVSHTTKKINAFQAFRVASEIVSIMYNKTVWAILEHEDLIAELCDNLTKMHHAEEEETSHSQEGENEMNFSGKSDSPKQLEMLGEERGPKPSNRDSTLEEFESAMEICREVEILSGTFRKHSDEGNSGHGVRSLGLRFVSLTVIWTMVLAL